MTHNHDPNPNNNPEDDYTVYDPNTQTYEIMNIQQIIERPENLFFSNFDAEHVQMYFARFGGTLDCQMLIQLPPIRIGNAIHPATILERRQQYDATSSPKYVSIALAAADHDMRFSWEKFANASFLREALIRSRKNPQTLLKGFKTSNNNLSPPVRTYNDIDRVYMRIPVNLETKQLDMYVATCLDPQNAPNVFHHNKNQQMIPQSWATFVCSMHISINPKMNYTGGIILTARQVFIHQRLKTVNVKKQPVMLVPFTFNGVQISNITVVRDKHSEKHIENKGENKSDEKRWQKRKVLMMKIRLRMMRMKMFMQ